MFKITVRIIVAVILAAIVVMASLGGLDQLTLTASADPPDVVETEPRAFVPQILHNYCPDYFDDFSNPASGWPAGTHQFVDYGYSSGEYRVYTKQDGYVYTFSSPSCPREDYVVEVDARWAGSLGYSYGIVFGIVGNHDQYYLFEVNSEYQVFQLYYLGLDGWHEIVEDTYASAIHSGNASNHLTVTRAGSNITLAANGVTLAEVTGESRLTGFTYAGVASSPYNGLPNTDARFDNFSMSQYREKVPVINAAGIRQLPESEDGAMPNLSPSPARRPFWPAGDR